MAPHLSGSVVAAIRPDDLVPVAAGEGLAASVEAIEYRGHDYFGVARATDGTELFFRSTAPLATGLSIALGAEPSKILVYPGETP